MKHIIVLLVLMGLTVPVWAQETIDPAFCEMDRLAAELVTIAEDLTSGNLTLSRLVFDLSYLNAACQNLVFNSDEYGTIGVIGPLGLSGTYIARFNAPEDTYNAVKITELDGDCDERLLFSAAESLENATVAFQPDCTALIEVEAGDGWELSLEPLTDQ